ncbi:MAG: CapA family protein [Spirochaetota bacterium]
MLSMKKYTFYLLLGIFFFVGLSATSKTRSKRVKILLAGDVMFDWGFRQSNKKFSKDTIDPKLLKVFRSVDYRMVNLESPITESQQDLDSHKSYVFRGYPNDLEILRRLQVNLVFLGNNHSMDYGKAGLLDTFSHLKKYRIGYAGAGKNRKEAYSPVRLSEKLSNYHIVSASRIGLSRLFAGYRRPGSALYSLPRLGSIARRRGKKHIYLLSLHWGIEYSPEPSGWQIRHAHSLIRSGYKAVIGHHPHIPQGVEKYRNGVILYSLGNFFFGSRNQYLNHNIIAVLHFLQGELEKCEIIPVFGKFQYVKHHKLQLLPQQEAERFLWELAVASEKLNTKLDIKNGRAYIYFRKLE